MRNVFSFTFGAEQPVKVFGHLSSFSLEAKESESFHFTVEQKIMCVMGSLFVWNQPSLWGVSWPSQYDLSRAQWQFHCCMKCQSFRLRHWRTHPQPLQEKPARENEKQDESVFYILNVNILGHRSSDFFFFFLHTNVEETLTQTSGRHHPADGPALIGTKAGGPVLVAKDGGQGVIARGDWHHGNLFFLFFFVFLRRQDRKLWQMQE